MLSMEPYLLSLGHVLRSQKNPCWSSFGTSIDNDFGTPIVLGGRGSVCHVGSFWYIVGLVCIVEVGCRVVGGAAAGDLAVRCIAACDLHED